MIVIRAGVIKTLLLCVFGNGNLLIDQSKLFFVVNIVLEEEKVPSSVVASFSDNF